MTHICPCCGHEATVQQLEKDLVRVKKKPTPYESGLFEEFRSRYRGKKRGLDTELDNFIRHKDWRQVLPKLESMQIQWGCEYKFIPLLQTFINQRRWEMIEDVKPDTSPYGEEYNWRKS